MTREDEVYALGSNGAGCLGQGDMHSSLQPKLVEPLCYKVGSILQPKLVEPLCYKVGSILQPQLVEPLCYKVGSIL